MNVWPRRAALTTMTLLCLAKACPAATLTDSEGREIRLSQPFRRIVSLYSAHTENLFALGLDEEIVGVSRSETYPPEALGRPAFSHREDVERLLAVRPDLVLVRPLIYRGYPGFVSKLEGAGVAVVSLQPRGPGEMYDYWLSLGLLTGRQAEAEAQVQAFRTGLAAIEARLSRRQGPPKKVFLESIHRLMKTFAPESITAFALERAGGVNVADDARSAGGTNIAEYGKEAVLARGAEIDVYLAQRGAMNAVTREQILEEPGFGAIRAVQRKAVFMVDEDLVSRPTPRLLQGIRQIAGLLYPEVFPEEGTAP